MDELFNYIWDKEANTMRKESDENENPHSRNKNETILAQFEGEEDCSQFEMAVRQLRPDIKWFR